jgi:hypothetical protein
MSRVQAAILGAREVGFTVLSMSLSLIAVFIPILLMGGIVGRLFREFAMTLSIAILVSLAVSLSTTPMMCAYLLGRKRERPQGRLFRTSERAFAAMLGGYTRTLRWALDHPGLVVLTLIATVCLNGYLFWVVPKGLFPQQDTGRVVGGIQADQSISFQAIHLDHPQGSGGGHRRRIHGRRTDEFRLRVHVAQAAERAQALGRPGDRADAPRALAGSRRDAVPAIGPGHPGRRPPDQRAIPVHPAGRRRHVAVRLGP